MTPPTSNPSAMSQELSEAKLLAILRAFNNPRVRAVAEELLATRAALLSAQRKNEELVRALTEIRDFPIGDVYKNQIAANMAIFARQALRQISD